MVSVTPAAFRWSPGFSRSRDPQKLKTAEAWTPTCWDLRLNVECLVGPRFTYATGAQVMEITRLVRKTLYVWVCVFGAVLLGEKVEAADHPAFQPVKELFAAMSKHDGKAMQDTATEDFQLLEHGEDWTMQKLVDAVQPKGKPYVRKNFFKQIRARQKGDMAWVSYWNKAEIHRDGGMRTVVWLESAVMVREHDQWKVQLLHSTRLEPDKVPRDIEWVEFETTPK